MVSPNGMLFLAICGLSIFCVESEITDLLSEEEVVDYLVGSEVPDHYDNVAFSNVNMTYWMTNVVLGRMIHNDYSYTLKDGEVHAWIFSKYGHIRGDLYAVIHAGNSGKTTFNVVLNGTFVLYANDSSLSMTFLLPKPNGKSDLEMTSCGATYSSLNMIFNDAHYKDHQDLIALSDLLTLAMNKSLRSLYCKAMRADLAKKEDSKAVRGILDQIMLRVAIQRASSE